MWDGVDKSKLVQYRLKVELTDIMPYINGTQDQAIGQSQQREKEIFDSVTGNVKDKMLVDHREQLQARAGEESKVSSQSSNV